MAMLTRPFAHIQEIGVTELIGINEQVDQNDYSGSVELDLQGARPVSGEILAFAFYSTEDGSGAVLEPSGKLILFDADPAVSSGDTALAAAEFPTILGVVDVATADWHADANGAVAYIHDNPVPFHALTSVYAVWFHTLATSYNSAAGDDEQLEVNMWYRRDG